MGMLCVKMLLVMDIFMVFAQYIQPVRTKKELVINQHEDSQERVDCALRLKNEYGFKMPLYADTMDNEFMTEYAGWPLQVLLIFNDKIKWNLQPKRPGYFDFNDLKSILEEFSEC